MVHLFKTATGLQLQNLNNSFFYLRSILAERNVCLSWTTPSGTTWMWWPPCSSRSSASSLTQSSPQKCTTYLSMRVKSRKPTRDLMHLENYFTNCPKSIMKPCCTSSVILGWDFVKRKFSQFSYASLKRKTDTQKSWAIFFKTSILEWWNLKFNWIGDLLNWDNFFFTKFEPLIGEGRDSASVWSRPR